MIFIPDFIYPKDSSGNPLCPKCKKIIKECDCPVLKPARIREAKVNPNIFIEKAGRMGKVVTVIKNLPTSEAYLKDLAKKLKVKTGSGGTFYIKDNLGVVELQGDHKKIVEQFFDQQI